MPPEVELDANNNIIVKINSIICSFCLIIHKINVHERWMNHSRSYTTVVGEGCGAKQCPWFTKPVHHHWLLASTEVELDAADSDVSYS